MRKLLILSIVCVLFAYTSCKKANSSTNNNNNDTTANNHNNNSNNSNTIVNNDTTHTVPPLPGTITVDINGTPDSFNTNAIAYWLSGYDLGSAAYGITIRGAEYSGVDSTTFTFHILGQAPITAGYYNSDNNGTSAYGVIFFYIQNAYSSFESIGGHNQGGNNPDSIGITITSIDSTVTHRVQGTFHGEGLNVSQGPMISDTFTNGKFDVPLVNKQ